ncbi:MAG: sulfatase-like hydrolase/transferase [Planctomycetes bacterium]|nr:sulfatase-like hydrolase/transferase [Planctomycetota bacterium]
MKSKPNVLIIFTDMQRADTIHALGNPVIKTPNLDRLVAEGTAFVNCHSPSPVCVPARCCMHYGQYPQTTGLYDNGAMPPDNGKSIPAILSRESYFTASIGKCHFLPNKLEKRGFDMRLIQEECCSDPEVDDYCRYLKDNGLDYDEPQGTRGEMYYIPQPSLHDAASHPSQWLGDRSVDFIKENSSGQRPWMLFSSFIHPHPPFCPPKPWHKLYRAAMMPYPFVPDNCESTHTWVNRRQNRYKYRDQGIDRNLLRCMKAYYYACISFVDFQIGRILSALEEKGQLDNTLIIFSSDHGEYLGDYNCFGKRGMHDASSRVPLIVRYPERFEAGKISSAPASLVDFMPTIFAASGSPCDDVAMEGVDLSALAKGDANRDTVFSQYQKGERAIYMSVSEKWKYIYSAGDDREFLFDRLTDPGESVNKAGIGFLRPSKDAMKKELLDYLKSAGATEAFTETENGLDWKRYPHRDESHLADPNAGLLSQDHDAYVLNEAGYTC